MMDPRFTEEHGIPVVLFQGVVESNNDPLHRGRVRVRVAGLHTKQKQEETLEGIKTEHLPWIDPVFPVGSNITGVGDFPIGPRQGTHLLVFYMDGMEFQKGFYLGSVSGSHRLEARSSEGYWDPDGKFPRKDRVPNDVDIPGSGDSPYIKDESRKSLGETIYDVIDENIKESNPDPIKGAFGESSFQEITPTSQPFGHDNHVRVYPSRDPESDNRKFRHGHTFQVDSTPEREHVTEYFAPSGNYKVTTGGGNVQERVDGNLEKYILGSVEKYVQESLNFVIGGTFWNKVIGDLKNEILGEVKEEISGEMNQLISGDKNVEASNITHTCGVHKLSGDSNSQPVDNIPQCPWGFMHSTINNVLVDG